MFEEWAGNPPVEFPDMDKDPVSFWCWKAWQKATALEREACAQLCHDAFMYLEHGTDRSDPQDDREAHMLALVAKDLRDDIKKRSNAAIEGPEQAQLANGPARMEGSTT